MKIIIKVTYFMANLGGKVKTIIHELCQGNCSHKHHWGVFSGKTENWLIDLRILKQPHIPGINLTQLAYNIFNALLNLIS